MSSIRRKNNPRYSLRLGKGFARLKYSVNEVEILFGQQNELSPILTDKTGMFFLPPSLHPLSPFFGYTRWDFYDWSYFRKKKFTCRKKDIVKRMKFTTRSHHSILRCAAAVKVYFSFPISLIRFLH